jgi:hypothetical protein
MSMLNPVFYEGVSGMFFDALLCFIPAKEKA